MSVNQAKSLPTLKTAAGLAPETWGPDGFPDPLGTREKNRVLGTASLIHADYEAEPAITSFEQAKAAGCQPAFPYGRLLNTEVGDAEAALAAAGVKIDEIYRTPRQNHSASPDPHAPMGAHGVGEIGITGVGAAVANAIYNATGKRIRDLPITLDKLL